jgi:hypothetical protein
VTVQLTTSTTSDDHNINNRSMKQQHHQQIPTITGIYEVTIKQPYYYHHQGTSTGSASACHPFSTRTLTKHTK